MAQAEPRLRKSERCVRPATLASDGQGIWPREIAGLYGIPLGLDGDGQCIGIIALGGGFLQTDVDAAMIALGLPSNLIFEQPVNGFHNTFGNSTTYDAEVSLDVQVVATMLPKARVVVYSAPNAHEDFIAAVTSAIADDLHRPSVLSISWGEPESAWSSDEIQRMEAALQTAQKRHITVVTASGDYLAKGGLPGNVGHVYFPGSSPNVLCCGGTQVSLTPDGDAIASEAVWNDNNGLTGSGGGISDVFPVPSYQQSMRLPKGMYDAHSGRGVPDVTALASQNPGYRVIVGGSAQPIGGTSGATPLWAAVIALANARRGSPLGLVNPYLYQRPDLCRRIVAGGNDGYDAGPDWSACAGLGVPDGTNTVSGLSALP